MSGEHIKKIVIVGGGTAGWMSATTLAQAFQGKIVEIVLVESDDIGTVGVGEATIPPIRRFNALAGIDEVEFVRRTQATFKLGIEFVNWTRQGHRYIHPFGFYGKPIDLISFHHYWLRLKEMGDETPLDAYSLPIMAARHNKFLVGPNDPDSVFATYSYAFHFDAGLYAQFLRQHCEARGVRRVEGKITKVNLNPEDGFIDSLTLDRGETIDGDLFIDCSGFRALLIGEALGVGYDDWSSFLPCNRAVAVPCESAAELTPYTRSTAHKAGWQWRIPLQHRTGNGHVFCADYISEDEAVSTLMNNLDGKPLADPRVIRFTTGKRKKFWEKNCIAVGLASGFMEPLESTSIHLVQKAMARAVGFLPVHRHDTVSVEAYNRLMLEEFIEIRDFLVLHYHATERDDSDFWTYCRHMQPPETLSRRMDLFRARGRVISHSEELFGEASYVAVFLGQGVTPQGYDPLANVLDADDVKGRLRMMREVISDTVQRMPTQAQFIERTCKAYPLDKLAG
ncbi:tryptophan halogenase family protein [Asticcacaulis sp.]|uniref:tryptophan halogenase family protein n=1 Tax=Asticcacaulis sp. TaxID=1872648 RepID=UPI00262FB0B4|nr:tryptophan halogenase family protein [Asticcacaulis sp.]